MKQLYAPTEDFIKLDRSFLDADANAGSAVTVVLGNNDSFALNDYVVIGYEGSELCEMVQISSAVTAGKNIVVATLKFNHKKGEPVTKYRYNKRKFYGWQ